MDGKTEYAEMLDLPMSTCEITYTPPKKRFFGFIKKSKKNKTDEIKSQLIEKVNENAEEPLKGESGIKDETKKINGFSFYGKGETEAEKDVKVSDVENTSIIKRKKRKKFKFGIIGTELVVIGLLLCAIVYSSIAYPNSGINVFLRGVFGRTEQADLRVYSDFTPVANTGIGKADGTIFVEKGQSVYSPCDGVVKKVELENGEYTVTVSHSLNFSTTVKGLKYSYVKEGEQVKSLVPVGYSGSLGSVLCFLGENGDLITGYTVNGKEIQWTA